MMILKGRRSVLLFFCCLCVLFCPVQSDEGLFLVSEAQGEEDPPFVS